jgi:hypothetical protein
MNERKLNLANGGGAALAGRSTLHGDERHIWAAHGEVAIGGYKTWAGELSSEREAECRERSG